MSPPPSTRRARGTYDTVDHWVGAAELRLAPSAGRALRALAVRANYTHRRHARLGELMDAIGRCERTAKRAVAALVALGIARHEPDGYALAPGARAACERLVKGSGQAGDADVTPETANARAARDTAAPEGKKDRRTEERVLSTSLNLPRFRPPATGARENINSSIDEGDLTPVAIVPPAATPATVGAGAPPGQAVPGPGAHLLALPGFADAWSEWRAYRRELGRPLTPAVARAHLRLLEADPDPLEMVRYSVASGRWPDLYPERPRTRGNASRAGTPADNSRPDLAARDGWARERWLAPAIEQPAGQV